jgi:DNA-binding GntR family transcriptional regulator
VTYPLPGRSAEIGREYQAIVDVVARRDPDGADAAARLHIQRNGQMRMSLLIDIDETTGVPLGTDFSNGARAHARI